MSECRSCGASWPSDGQVCLYCGSEIPERVMEQAQEIQERRDRLSNIQHGMAILRKMPTPSARHALIQVLWWYLLLGTLGLSYIFWKRPKSVFDHKTYKRLVDQIRWHNNEALRISAPAERPQFQQVEQELGYIERVVTVKRRGAIKATIFAVGLIFVIGLIGSAFDDEGDGKTKTEQKESK